MHKVVGLIPAAGKGVRAYPYTEARPKCLLEVDGVPLLRRNIELMRDQLGVRDVHVVIGHRGKQIREYLNDGSWLGVRAHFYVNDRLERGLTYSIYLGARHISDYCCVLLSDEFYLDTNHSDLLSSLIPPALVICGLIKSDSIRLIHHNYSVQIENAAIVGLVENPEQVVSNWMGVGTYLLHPDALSRLTHSMEKSDHEVPSDWTTWLDRLSRSGGRILPFYMKGSYVNVNDREGLNLANHLSRNREFESRKVSLVYLVGEVEELLEESVLCFAEANSIDEVVVAVRGSAVPGPLCTHPKIRVVRRDCAVPLGTLLRDGMDEAKGDILIITYDDGTFSPRDLEKLLVYVRDADLVVGTRTTRQMIEGGSNMRGIVRTAHVAIAKLMEILWWRFDSRFTDVCCVYRAIWRSTYRTIRSELTAPGIEIFPEMVIEVLRARLRVIEIPVNYHNPDQEQKFVWSKYQTVGTFLRILWLLLRKRFLPRSSRAAHPKLEVGAESDV